MVTFRNNNGRRNGFRRNDRNYKTNGERQKFGSNFTNSENFQRKNPGRNNHNAPKLIEKYNDLAREALSNGDKILSENYLQHADHFTRILNEREMYRKEKFLDNRPQNDIDINDEANNENSEQNTNKVLIDKDKDNDQTKIENTSKSQAEIN